MQVVSKGILSDFIFHEYAGSIETHPNYTKVHTRNNPSYYYGNSLIYPHPPSIDDMQAWQMDFNREFGHDPNIRHMTFQWTPDNKADKKVIDAFVAAGFTYDYVSVLTAKATKPTRTIPDNIIFRAIETDAEWAAVVDLQSADGFPNVPAASHRQFKQSQFANYRAMAEAGIGHWFGAFKQDMLVADMGLYFGEGIGRFQAVETAKHHRRLGICSAMVHWVSQWAFERHPGITLMIHADYDDIASALYQSLGYREYETLESVFKQPRYPSETA